MKQKSVQLSTSRHVGRPTSYRAEYCTRVVELMTEGRSLDGCAAILGVHPDSLYTWQRLHDEFSDAVKAGRAAAISFWESRLLDVAQGGPGNAQVIQWALRNRSRAASGWDHAHAKVELSGPNGGAVQVQTDLSEEEYNRRVGKMDSAKKLSEKAKIIRDAWHAYYPNETIQYSHFASEVVLAEKYEAGKLTKAQYIAESAAISTKTDILQSNKDAQREMIELQREAVRNSNKSVICNTYGTTTICN